MKAHERQEALLAKAAALLEVGRTDAAREQAAAALAADPHDAAALHLIARSYQAEDDFGPMREAAAQAVALEPQQYQGHLLLALAQVGLDDAGSARTSALESIRLQPENWSGYAALAMAEFNLGHKRRAFRTIRTAIGLAPESPGPHYIRALLYDSMGWSRAAKRAYRHALALDPEHGPALTALGRIAVNAVRLTMAAGHLSTVLAVEPTDHGARTQLDRVIIGGFLGWALMSVWCAGFLGAFVAFWWMWLPTLLVPALFCWWAARGWRALSPGARGYARTLLRTDIRARVRLVGVALCGVTAAGMVITGSRLDPHRVYPAGEPHLTALLIMLGAHVLALLVAGIAGLTADRRVAGPPQAAGQPRTAGPPRTAGAGSRATEQRPAVAGPRPTDLLAEHRRSSTAGRWALRLTRTGALLAVVPWLSSVDPPAPWPARAAVAVPALAAFAGYLWWSRRRLIRRPGSPNAALGFLLIPLTLAVLAELAGIVATAALPPAAMPLPDAIAVPAFLAIAIGLLAWLGWLPYAGIRALGRLSRGTRS
jgi:tetratricopeptide (TPR) repeat protein